VNQGNDLGPQSQTPKLKPNTDENANEEPFDNKKLLSSEVKVGMGKILFTEDSQMGNKDKEANRVEDSDLKFKSISLLPPDLKIKGFATPDV
jgi:hypothetical protein